VWHLPNKKITMIYKLLLMHYFRTIRLKQELENNKANNALLLYIE